MTRSLTVSKQHLASVKRALRYKPFPSQRAIAAELGFAPSTASRFFTGKSVDYETFVRLCDALNLDWYEIAGLKSKEDTSPRLPSPDPTLTLPPLNDSPPSMSSTLCDWGDAIDVSAFVGRESELTTLQQWVMGDAPINSQQAKHQHPCCRLVTILGMGGIGKTVLAIKLAQQIQNQFDSIIWRSLRSAPPILELLGDLIGVFSPQQDRGGLTTVDQGIDRLLGYLRQSRCLLILDNGETLLQSGDRNGRYRAEYADYGQLLQAIGGSSHKSCLVLTTREQPCRLTAKQGVTSPIRCFKLGGLSVGDCQHLLSTKGWLIGSTVEWADLVKRYGGNPLALMTVRTFVSEFFAGHIHPFLELLGRSPFMFDAIKILLDQQIQRLSDLEKEIMHWLALKQKPVSLSALHRDLPVPISAGELLQVLVSLQNRSLIERSQDGFTQQPIVMEYMYQYSRNLFITR